MISFEALAQEAYEAHRAAMRPYVMLTTWAYLDAHTRAAWVETVKRVAQRLSELH